MARGREVWLRSNQRAVAVGTVVPLALATLGVLLLCSSANWAQWIGALCLMAGLVVAASLLVVWKTPLLAYQDGTLLVYMDWTTPQRVPIELVECFFCGEHKPRFFWGGQETKVKSVIVRLAESASEYHERPVRPALGQWKDGYITIYGAWTEPLTVDLMRRLNDRLREIHVQRQKGRQSHSTVGA